MPTLFHGYRQWLHDRPQGRSERCESPGPLRFIGRGGRTATAERSIASLELFAGAKVVIIEHAGERYRLRRTSKGKLILTK